jgi:hypothetical protein
VHAGEIGVTNATFKATRQISSSLDDRRLTISRPKLIDLRRDHDSPSNLPKDNSRERICMKSKSGRLSGSYHRHAEIMGILEKSIPRFT